MSVSHYDIYYELKAVECQKYYIIKNMENNFPCYTIINTRKITYTSATSVKQFTKIVLMMACVYVKIGTKKQKKFAFKTFAYVNKQR